MKKQQVSGKKEKENLGKHRAMAKHEFADSRINSTARLTSPKLTYHPRYQQYGIPRCTCNSNGGDTRISQNENRKWSKEELEVRNEQWTRKNRVVRVPGGIAFDCDVVEPPGGPRGQEVRGRSVVRATSTARLPRGEIAGRAEEEVGWCDLRRHPAQRGGGAGGGGGDGGVEQLLPDSEEEESTAMSRQLRGERDHVSRDYQEGYLGDFRDLRDLRDFRDFHRDPLGDIRDDRDSQGHREGPVAGRTYRDDYPEEYDHRPTAASTSANLTNNPGRLNGRVTLHEGRNDLQLVNLCVPTRSAIVVSRSIVMLLDANN
ncbi:uncharacterized protein LOC115242384 isoform X2 [Formica exsecta]|uniref:uncharacterized protein LOC115242384 isoform X2 n=1 Tax=Formica exsecta TaxID=72781 RepID=UPI0011429BCC|nr:uncharacterized protein LOC115242384 isoform X2 [Formica exsecta]